MKLTKKQKQYLSENFRHESDAALAKQLGISEDSICQAFKQLHLKRTEAELRALQDSENKKKTKKYWTRDSTIITTTLILRKIQKDIS